MEAQIAWVDRLSSMEVNACVPLDTPASSVYSAIRYHKDEFDKENKKFRVHQRQNPRVCRVK